MYFRKTGCKLETELRKSAGRTERNAPGALREGGNALLNERMERFVAECINGHDAAAAALAAGYSPGRARRQGAELLRRPEVIEALAKARAEAPAEVDQARVVRELARIAFADPVDLIDGAEATLSEAEARTKLGGTGLKYTPKRGGGPDGETVFELSMEREVRVGDKLRALELLTKLLGLAAGSEDADGGGGVVLLPEVEEEGGE